MFVVAALNYLLTLHIFEIYINLIVESERYNISNLINASLNYINVDESTSFLWNARPIPILSRFQWRKILNSDSFALFSDIIGKYVLVKIITKNSFVTICQKLMRAS